MPAVSFSFFPGCTAHSTSAEYTASIAAVFAKLGVSLTEIDDWNCCGAAATHSLNRRLSLALPARNIAQAQKSGAGPLAIPCAGCFQMLKRAEHALKAGGEERRFIEETVGFTWDERFEILALIDAVVDRIGLAEVAAKVQRPLAGLTAAAYYGCALVRNPKVTGLGDPEAPLFLDRLIRTLGAEPADWSFGTECCGADLALTYGKEVGGMVDRIVERAAEAGADCLVTSCGLCQANLEMRQKAGMPVFYFTELMGIAFDLPGRKRWWAKHMVDPTPLLRRKGLL